MSADVEYYTKLAGEKLHKRQAAEDAIDNFREAVKSAIKSCDTDAVDKCTVNLGAALVALGRTSEGLRVLEPFIPPQRDYLLAGHRWYNLGLAHEVLENTAEAVKCIQQAIKCYDESQCSDAVVLKAGSLCRLASLYTQQQEFGQAAETYKVAAFSYSNASDVLQQAVCLFQQARLLGWCNKAADALAVTDECTRLCSELPDATAGKCVQLKKNDVHCIDEMSLMIRTLIVFALC